MINIKIVFAPANDQEILRLAYLNIPKLKELFQDEINLVPEMDILNNGSPYIELMGKKIYINEFDEDLFAAIKRVVNKQANITDEFTLYSIKRDKMFQDGVYVY